MKNVLIILIASSLIGCRSGSLTKSSSISTCGTPIEIQVDKMTKESKKEGMVVDVQSNSFTIYFMNEFDHHLKFWFENQLLFDDQILTNETSGTTEKYVSMKYENSNLEYDAKVSLGTGECAEFQFKPKYKIVYLFFDADSACSKSAKQFPTM